MIIVVTLLATLVGAISSEHYHIVPVNSTALCQHYPNGTCFTLDQLSSQISDTGNITISFFPGDHLLTWNITFFNRTNITLNREQLVNLSNSTSRIICVPNTGINVRDIDTFTLQGLVIYGCNKYGGGYVISLLRTTAVIKNTVFRDNSIVSRTFGHFAAVLATKDCIATIHSCMFEFNTAFGNLGNAGVVVVRGGSLHIMNSTFKHNRAHNIGSIVLARDTMVHITSSPFEYNTGPTVNAVLRSTWHVTNSAFQHNTAANNCGGAVSSLSSVVYVKNSTFSDNKASRGGAICLFEHSEITLDTSIMKNNRASHGGAVYLEQSTLNINGEVAVIADNSAIHGGGIFSVQSTIHLKEGNAQILSNTAQQDGGGVYLSVSSFVMNGNALTIDSNTAQSYGGGLYLQDRSQLLYGLTTTHIQLTNNTAVRGGAIHISDSGSGPVQCSESLNKVGGLTFTKQCFIRPITLVWAYFANNNAIESGSDIYGGLLDRCNVHPYFFTGINFILRATEFSWSPGHRVQNIEQLYNHISSDPVRVCVCQSDVINCNYTYPTVYKKKGETFTLSVVAVDQVGKPVNATLISSLPQSENSRLKEGQQSKQIRDRCTELEYNVYSTDSTALLQIYADGPCGNQGISKQDVNITFEPCTCPIGFDNRQDPIECSCDCADELKPYISNCSPERKTIQINEDIWIEHISQANSTIQFVTRTCPFDYCVQKPVNISFANQTESDRQCAFNRAGRLCGQCVQGLSLVFASSRCQQCSNYHLFLILPFALAGIALVVFILLLNMTVATGTIHGLIFYANILAANHTIFLPFENENPLTIFISWLNLDLGIQTCFYNGMDSYAKFLLQLVFPAYVFLLIAIIMVLCNHSQRIASLFGKKNPEATLYTLVLISYSKLFRIIITALQFALMTYPDGQKVFWLFNANTPYFTANHIPRFLVAFIITILGAVYTTLLLFGQLFNRCSEHRLMKWTTHRYYIHFLKAHHAPLSDKHRYWVGLLLLARLVHYLISTFANDSLVILSVGAITGALLLLKNNKKIYNKWAVNLLETLFMANLNIFSLTTLYIKVDHPGGQKALAFVSLFVSFMAFLGIVIYHILDACGVKLDELPNKVYTKLREYQHHQPVAVCVIEEQLRDDNEVHIEFYEVNNYVDNDTDDCVNDRNNPAHYITPPIIRSAIPADQLREPALDDLIPVQPKDYNIPPTPQPQCREPTFTEIDIRTRKTD